MKKNFSAGPTVMQSDQTIQQFLRKYAFMFMLRKYLEYFCLDVFLEVGVILEVASFSFHHTTQLEGRGEEVHPKTILINVSPTNPLHCTLYQLQLEQMVSIMTETWDSPFFYLFPITHDPIL